MVKICTDINQSKKLLELGIDVKTADMYWWATSKRYYVEAMDDGDFNEWEGHIPAWSLSALLDVLKSEIDGEEGETYQLNIEKDGTWWNVWYKERYDEANPIETESTEDLVDACVKMIIKLKENNKI